MLRLKRLKVHRFRHVEPGIELHFGNTFNVLLGKNAAGKTTLLELINAILNDDFTPLHGEHRGFDLEYELSLADETVTMQCRLARDPVEGAKTNERDGEPVYPGKYGALLGTRFREHGSISWKGVGEEPWTCRIEERKLSYNSKQTGELDDDPSSGSRYYVCQDAQEPKARFWFSDWRSDVVTSFVERAPRFDEADGFLAAIAAPRVVELDSPGTGNPYYLVAEGWPEGMRDLALETTTLDSNLLQFDSAKDSSLHGIVKCLGFERVEISARLAERSDDGARFEKPWFLFESGDRKVALPHLSFGQRRFFLFLWYLALRERLPLVVDELVNGFHHEWISQCVDRLRGKQSFLATQNPLLLDDLPVMGLDEPPTTFIRCEGRRDQMSWRTFTTDEAARIAKAREVGIQSVSEALRFEGLW